MNFGAELKRMRESKGMTVNQLAMYSGISGASISRYETGDRGIPKPPTLEKLAKGLKVEYTDLMRLAGHLKETDPNGEVYEPGTAEDFLEYLELGLTHEEIKERADFFVDILKLNDEEIREFKNWVDWRLAMKKEQQSTPSSKPDEL